MSVQKTDWGQIQWMESKDSSLFQLGLKVGIVTMQVGSHHPPHRHYDEQVNYIIQGQATSLINGEEFNLNPGEFYQWPIGVVHEIYNTGNIPFMHLMISNPESVKIDQLLSLFTDKSQPLHTTKQQAKYQLYQALEAVRTQFLETMNYPYSIFDTNGNLIAQGEYFPPYCTQSCHGKISDGKCPCMAYDNFEQFQEEQTLLCPYGMKIFSIPLILQNQFMGCIQGGYFWQSQSGKLPTLEVYDTPESTAISIQKMLRKIAKAIQNHCEFQQIQQDLNEKSMEITSSRQSQKDLMKNLKAAEYAMTDLRINHHFLSNTLNSMGKMALDGGLPSLYNSIVSLSKMFYYTLNTQSMMVTLKQELDYVRAYLQLQKLRFKDQLIVTYDAEPHVLSLPVPFNFLQPIVENAFKHGFRDAIEKHLKICCKQNGKNLEIRVHNSGKEITAQKLITINKHINSNYPHGLSLINYKLKIVYKEVSPMEIFTDQDGYTCVQVKIPVNTTVKESTYDTRSNL